MGGTARCPIDLVVTDVDYQRSNKPASFGPVNESVGVAIIACSRLLPAAGTAEPKADYEKRQVEIQANIHESQ